MFTPSVSSLSDYEMTSIKASSDNGKRKVVEGVDTGVDSGPIERVATHDRLPIMSRGLGSPETSDHEDGSIKPANKGKRNAANREDSSSNYSEMSDHELFSIKSSTDKILRSSESAHTAADSIYTYTYCNPDPHGIGDRLCDAYPDRNLGEIRFPGISNSKNTPALQALYDEVFAGIFRAIHDDFRSGHFKTMFTADRSILSIILDMEMSGEVSKEQFNILWRFGRGWAKAIGESANWAILNENFIEFVGLEYAYGDLMYMFEEEKKHPLPYPLPEHLRYHDPKTMREKFDVAAEYQEAKEGSSTGYIPAKPDAPHFPFGGTPHKEVPVFSAADTPNFVATSEHTTLQEVGITKEMVLATLAQYSAKTSPDRILRNAWKEISALKGELDNEAIEKLSDESVELMHRHIQSVCAQKNIPMPMGEAIQATVERLEKLDFYRSAVVVNRRSDVYDPPAPDSLAQQPSTSDSAC